VAENQMIECMLGRLVRRDEADAQFLYLTEVNGTRGFSIAIGVAEAQEIERLLIDEKPKRPLTHELAFHILQALGASLKHVDVVDLRQNTFFAQIALQNEAGDVLSVVDARPSDAIALALRARCPIRVAEKVLEQMSAPE
jgi:uncharacterized protein